MSARSATYRLIRKAVLTKQVVTAAYGGHLRLMCPHVPGIKGGREQGLFYQFGGMSSGGEVQPGSPDNWRCIVIAGLSDAGASDGEWDTADNGPQARTCVDEIDVQWTAEAV